MLFAAAALQGQWIKQINFSPAEGYTNGPLWGQPAAAGADVWTCVSENTGDSYVLEDGTRHICMTVTNEAMMIRPDQNLGDLKSVIYFAIPFTPQKKGPVTVTWDWQFFPTNEIPGDYDPTNNNYQATLQGTDFGFTLSDSANRALGDSAVWAVFNELSTPTRMGGLCDSRYNGTGDYGTCGGGGSWNDKGPQYKDGKKLHMKLVAYFGDPNDPRNDSFDVWAQREGEEVWHTTVNDLYPEGRFPMRRCPGEAGGEPKIDCVTLWLNTGVYSTAIVVDNIRIYGPSLDEPAPETSGQPAELGQTVNGFQDDFTGATRNPNWVVRGPGGDGYEQADGLLRVSVRTGDPNHLLYEASGYSTNVQEVLARMRVVAFGVNADGPRGGLGVGVATNNSQGINLHFRNSTQDNVAGRQWKLLDDARAWGPAGLKSDWQTNVWYWLRLRQEKDAGGGTNDVFAKVWAADGATPEPAAWQMTWNYIPTRSERGGFAGITGSSIDGIGSFEVDYVLIKADGLPSIKVAFPEQGPPPTTPRLTRVSRASATQVAIEWVGAAGLQSTTDLVNGPWTAIPTAASPYKVTSSGTPKFFRLVW